MSTTGKAFSLIVKLNPNFVLPRKIKTKQGAFFSKNRY